MDKTAEESKTSKVAGGHNLWARFLGCWFFLAFLTNLNLILVVLISERIWQSPGFTPGCTFEIELTAFA